MMTNVMKKNNKTTKYIRNFGQGRFSKKNLITIEQKCKPYKKFNIKIVLTV